MIQMMARESVKPYGLYSKFPIRKAAMFLTFTTKGMKYLKSCMNSAWNKAMQIVI